MTPQNLRSKLVHLSLQKELLLAAAALTAVVPLLAAN